MDQTLARQAFDAALIAHRSEFGAFFLARLLELDITYPDETCVISFPIRDFLFNPQGSLHGGAIAIVMDISMGHLLRESYGRAGATLEMKLQYLRPLKSGRARCVARFLQRGNSIAFLESKLTDAEGQLAVVATSTWKCSSAPTPAAREASPRQPTP